MSKDKSKPAFGGKGGAAPVERAKPNSAPPTPAELGAKPAEPVPPPKRPPFFRPCDWISFGITTLLTFIGYYLTLAPDLTLEDSGELAVGSYYAGVPHPPGYPVWTLYTWLFTVLVPVSNIAWRVALSSAVAAALSSGFLALITSRGSSMILESIETFKNIDRKAENLLCIVAGWVAGMLIAFNGYMWSQAVIAEVYTLSVLSLVLVFVLLMRWTYTPEKARWLLGAFFVFGLCFTNHQTLICAAMGIQVLIALTRPQLGRDLLVGNVIAYLVGVAVRGTGVVNLFEGNVPVFIIFHVVGLLSIASYVILLVTNPKNVFEVARDWVLYLTLVYGLFTLFMMAGSLTLVSSGGRFLWFVLGCGLVGASVFLVKTTWRTMLDWLMPIFCGLMFLLGASFYLYMPLASMTNPPMNWGYPRTIDGFIHAFTRGQYEKTNPTESVGKLVEQCWMLLEGAIEEFSPIYLLIALIPFLLLRQMQRRERAWLIGHVAIYGCLSVLLIILLNPNSDKQSRDLTKVFFTASHFTIAMCAGYGVALIAGMIQTRYREYRDWLLYGGAIMSAIALYGLALILWESALPLDKLNAYFGFGVMIAITALVLVSRERLRLGLFLGLVAITPAYTVMNHWSDNEQRGHLFGWYFGHDMFIPPFTDSTGKLSYDPEERRKLLADAEQAKLVYPEMTTNAVLFGGTDPGRFCPTYMIFCESFIKPEQRRNPDFDRRDVYIITQNALADHTYLSYIRAHYNRSTQEDPPFFQALLLSDRERTNPPKRQWEIAGTKTASKLLLGPLDRFFTRLGADIEARRRAEGVYPPAEIYTPTPLDSARSFEEYLQDAGRRKMQNLLRPGEVVDIVPTGDGKERIQVAGQVSVMAINGILAKIIFDQNPTNEFFVEESFPLDWMFPHLTPFGVIMKINREPVAEFTEELFQRDRHFWQQYSDRLIGNWITEETTVQEICDFVRRVYERRDYTGFEGDPKFVRDDQAQKSFSKLRGAIAGTYLWRLGSLAGIPTPQQYLPKTEEARQRLIREAEFAWKQSFAFCPYSPEAVTKYIGLLLNLPGRMADARLIAQTALDQDPLNEHFQYLVREIERYQGSENSAGELQQQMNQLAASFQQNPANITSAFALASAYAQLRDSNAAIAVLDTLLQQSNVTADSVVQTALFARELRNVALMERALLRLTEVNPNSPEAWYDLSAMQASLNKPDEAVQNLRRALLLSDQRRKTDPNAKDLRPEVVIEERFAPLRSRPDWQAAMEPLQP